MEAEKGITGYRKVQADLVAKSEKTAQVRGGRGGLAAGVAGGLITSVFAAVVIWPLATLSLGDGGSTDSTPS